MASDSYTIIPAQPGYFLFTGQDDELLLDWPDIVIAWRVETEMAGRDWMSNAFPLTLQGEPGNYVAIQRPDGRVEMLDSIYPDLAAAAAEYKSQASKKL